MRYQTIITLGIALPIGNPHIQAQMVSLEYDTELQTNFAGDYNWVNLLRLNGSVQVSDNLTIGASTISIAKTSQQPLIDDMQGYSNIEENNLPLGIALLGVEYSNRASTFFLGIRNVNEDYFTSPVTSLFVNSSCGIFPTISGNYDIANYPLASWCLHYRAELDSLSIQTSLYNGLGHRRIAGHDNVFRFSPSRDGIFSITSVEYDNNGSNYSVGCAVYYGVHSGDEDGVEKAVETTSKKVTAVPWINIEQRLTDTWSLMLQASLSTSKSCGDCRQYYGLGVTKTINNLQLGVFADYARYIDCDELASELTCVVPLSASVTLQPALEVIKTASHTNTIGILRLAVCI